MPDQTRHIAFFLPTFPAGGQEHTTLLLMKGLVERGHRVDLLLERKVGAYLPRVPETIPIHELKRRSRWSGYRRLIPGWPSEGFRHLRGSLGLGQRSIPLHRLIALVDYMETQRPDVVISAHDRAPLLAIWAAGIARRRVATIVIEHSLFSYNRAAAQHDNRTAARMQRHEVLMRRLYPLVDARVAVSRAAGEDLADVIGMPHEAVSRIYNPVVSAELACLAEHPIDDAWFAPGAPPVILAAARLAPEKNLDVLIEAFAELRHSGVDARLILLGDGPERDTLCQRIDTLGLAAEIRLPGWVDNPYAWMRHSALFVVSSAFEGLSNTLIEAMACGCPVVSTDCPGGPREILQDGRYGALVPVGDVGALAHAMRSTLSSPTDRNTLIARASDFAVDRAIDEYEALIEGVCAAPDIPAA
ncbi:glycoside hydrolase family protein [Salinisphaera sp. S4-8]|uniref:glycosyltransferase n=1 Tax=Salinisphaera sp. S4-8 TaxID=633357 RepID=UPI003342A251